MDIALIILLSVLGFGTLCLLYGFFVEPLWIRHRKIEVRFPSLYRRIPCAGKKIVFFSDLHTGLSSSKKMLLRRVRAIMRGKPDVIIFGGDLVEEKTPLGDTEFRATVLRALSSLDAPLGKWAIFGNHDVEAPRYREWTLSLLRDAGFTLLENEGIELDGLPIWAFADALHGQPMIDFESFSSIQNQCAQSSGLTDGAIFSLYLVHESDWFTNARPAPGPAVVLTGHSHHGQVTFFGIPLIRPPMGRELWRGIYRIGDQLTQIVSAGLGTVHIHARFFARPDIVTLTFVENRSRGINEIEVVEL